MPNATPAVVEKTLIDLNCTGGLNEYDRPESLDWTKFLKVSDNVDFGDQGVMRSRNGLYSVADEWDTNSAGTYTVGSLLRVLSTGSGVIALGGTSAFGFRAFHLNESSPSVQSNTKGVLSDKGYAPEFSLTPYQLGACNGATPTVIGAAQTARYNISVLSPDHVSYFVYFQDRESGNVVRSYSIGYATSSASMCLVSSRYLHVYCGTAASAKVFQFDTESLPDTVPTGVTLTSGTYIVGSVAISTSSYVVMRNGNISKVGTTPTETATGSVAGFGANELHDVTTDGTSIFIIGLDATPRGLIKVVSTALSTTRTVTDTDATLSAARFSIGVSSTQNAYIIAHYATTVGAFTIPTARVISCGSAGTIFASVQVLPGWGQVSAPFHNAANNAWYCALIQLPDAGLGAGHSLVLPGGSCVLARLDINPWPLLTPPAGFHCAATLDAYLDYVGANHVTKGYLSGDSPNRSTVQHIYTHDAGKTLVLNSIQRLGPSAFAGEFRELKLYDSRNIVCATDVVSGGRTSFYDGVCLSEIGCHSVPWCTAVDAAAGTGVDLGTRSYLVVFESIDATGRRHFSRVSNPFSYTMAAAKNVTVNLSFPNISNHLTYLSPSGGSGALYQYTFKYHIYRTVAGGTQFHLVASSPLDLLGAYTTATIAYTDSTSDATLASGAILYRQPGTLGTALDRYPPPASSCCVRHKDRVFVARGSDVYYSSYDVYGEAPWFNPAFQFRVNGATGPITAMASMDGMLVIFKKNGIFIVDGDGPPENGGSGTEFSPPRTLQTEYGCIDARTLVPTNNSLMFVSRRGIEVLSRNLTVEWIGKRVFRTINASPYLGGAAFDSATNRCVWLMADTAGTYPGQLSSSGVGYAVAYNVSNDTWTRYKLRPVYGYGAPFQDVCSAEAGSSILSIPSANRFVYIDDGKVWFEYGRVDRDSADAFVPVHIETGWVKGPSKFDNIRVTDLYTFANRVADVAIAYSYASDYSTTYTAVKSFAATVTSGMTVVQLDVMPPKEAVQSMSFKIVTSDPTPTSMGTGAGWDIFGLSVRVGLRGGGRGLATAQRG